MKRFVSPTFNRLLAGLKAKDQALLAPHLEDVLLSTGEVLFEPGDDVSFIHFPERGAITGLVLQLRNGDVAETAMIGWEGAIGGVISEGNKPAFARGVVQVGGHSLRLSTDRLEAAKLQSASLRDHFARYADCLLAEVLQSVACNAVHGLEARLARWLLSVQGRIGTSELHVTQEFISEMLGVRRPYITRVMGVLEGGGAIQRRRGRVEVVDRARLETQTCECYAYLKRHYERLSPGLYPSRQAPVLADRQ